MEQLSDELTERWRQDRIRTAYYHQTGNGSEKLPSANKWKYLPIRLCRKSWVHTTAWCADMRTWPPTSATVWRECEVAEFVSGWFDCSKVAAHHQPTCFTLQSSWYLSSVHCSELSSWLFAITSTVNAMKPTDKESVSQMANERVHDRCSHLIWRLWRPSVYYILCGGSYANLNVHYANSLQESFFLTGNKAKMAEHNT